MIRNSNKVLFHGARGNLRACSVYESFAASQHHLCYIIKGRVSRNSDDKPHVGNILETDTEKIFQRDFASVIHTRDSQTWQNRNSISQKYC